MVAVPILLRAARILNEAANYAAVRNEPSLRLGQALVTSRLAPQLEIFRMGKGLVVGEATPEHRTAAHEALEFVRQALRGGRYGVVVADEVLTAVGLHLLTAAEVESLLADRPPPVHLVLTGRGAWPGLIARADLVTEMRAVKHPFDKGVTAQPGVDF
jgi:cob(I)alamin adenosyltransferase